MNFSNDKTEVVVKDESTFSSNNFKQSIEVLKAQLNDIALSYEAETRDLAKYQDTLRKLTKDPKSRVFKNIPHDVLDVLDDYRREVNECEIQADALDLKITKVNQGKWKLPEGESIAEMESKRDELRETAAEIRRTMDELAKDNDIESSTLEIHNTRNLIDACKITIDHLKDEHNELEKKLCYARELLYHQCVQNIDLSRSMKEVNVSDHERISNKKYVEIRHYIEGDGVTVDHKTLPRSEMLARYYKPLTYILEVEHYTEDWRLENSEAYEKYHEELLLKLLSYLNNNYKALSEYHIRPKDIEKVKGDYKQALKEKKKQDKLTQVYLRDLINILQFYKTVTRDHEYDRIPPTVGAELKLHDGEKILWDVYPLSSGYPLKLTKTDSKKGNHVELTKGKIRTSLKHTNVELAENKKSLNDVDNDITILPDTKNTLDQLINKFKSVLLQVSVEGADEKDQTYTSAHFFEIVPFYPGQYEAIIQQTDTTWKHCFTEIPYAKQNQQNENGDYIVCEHRPYREYYLMVVLLQAMYEKQIGQVKQLVTHDSPAFSDAKDMDALIREFHDPTNSSWLDYWKKCKHRFETFSKFGYAFAQLTVENEHGVSQAQIMVRYTSLYEDYLSKEQITAQEHYVKLQNAYKVEKKNGMTSIEFIDEIIIPRIMSDKGLMCDMCIPSLFALCCDFSKYSRPLHGLFYNIKDFLFGNEIEPYDFHTAVWEKCNQRVSFYLDWKKKPQEPAFTDRNGYQFWQWNNYFQFFQQLRLQGENMVIKKIEEKIRTMHAIDPSLQPYPPVDYMTLRLFVSRMFNKKEGFFRRFLRRFNVAQQLWDNYWQEEVYGSLVQQYPDPTRFTAIMQVPNESIYELMFWHEDYMLDGAYLIPYDFWKLLHVEVRTSVCAVKQVYNRFEKEFDTDNLVLFINAFVNSVINSNPFISYAFFGYILDQVWKQWEIVRDKEQDKKEAVIKFCTEKDEYDDYRMNTVLRDIYDQPITAEVLAPYVHSSNFPYTSYMYFCNIYFLRKWEWERQEWNYSKFNYFFFPYYWHADLDGDVMPPEEPHMNKYKQVRDIVYKRREMLDGVRDRTDIIWGSKRRVRIINESYLEDLEMPNDGRRNSDDKYEESSESEIDFESDPSDSSDSSDEESFQNVNHDQNFPTLPATGTRLEVYQGKKKPIVDDDGFTLVKYRDEDKEKKKKPVPKPGEKKDYKPGDKKEYKPYEKKIYKPGEKPAYKPYEKKIYKPDDKKEYKPGDHPRKEYHKPGDHPRKEYHKGPKPDYKPGDRPRPPKHENTNSKDKPATPAKPRPLYVKTSHKTNVLQPSAPPPKKNEKTQKQNKPAPKVIITALPHLYPHRRPKYYYTQSDPVVMIYPVDPRLRCNRMFQVTNKYYHIRDCVVPPRANVVITGHKPYYESGIALEPEYRRPKNIDKYGYVIEKSEQYREFLRLNKERAKDQKKSENIARRNVKKQEKQNLIKVRFSTSKYYSLKPEPHRTPNQNNFNLLTRKYAYQQWKEQEMDYAIAACRNLVNFRQDPNDNTFNQDSKIFYRVQNYEVFQCDLAFNDPMIDYSYDYDFLLPKTLGDKVCCWNNHTDYAPDEYDERLLFISEMRDGKLHNERINTDDDFLDVMYGKWRKQFLVNFEQACSKLSVDLYRDEHDRLLQLPQDSDEANTLKVQLSHKEEMERGALTYILCMIYCVIKALYRKENEHTLKTNRFDLQKTYITHVKDDYGKPDVETSQKNALYIEQFMFAVIKYFNEQSTRSYAVSQTESDYNLPYNPSKWDLTCHLENFGFSVVNTFGLNEKYDSRYAFNLFLHGDHYDVKNYDVVRYDERKEDEIQKHATKSSSTPEEAPETKQRANLPAIESYDGMQATGSIMINKRLLPLALNRLYKRFHHFVVSDQWYNDKTEIPVNDVDVMVSFPENVRGCEAACVLVANVFREVGDALGLPLTKEMWVKYYVSMACIFVPGYIFLNVTIDRETFENKLRTWLESVLAKENTDIVQKPYSKRTKGEQEHKWFTLLYDLDQDLAKEINVAKNIHTRYIPYFQNKKNIYTGNDAIIPMYNYTPTSVEIQSKDYFVKPEAWTFIQRFYTRPTRLSYPFQIKQKPAYVSNILDPNEDPEIRKQLNPVRARERRERFEYVMPTRVLHDALHKHANEVNVPALRDPDVRISDAQRKKLSRQEYFREQARLKKLQEKMAKEGTGENRVIAPVPVRYVEPKLQNTKVAHKAAELILRNLATMNKMCLVEDNIQNMHKDMIRLRVPVSWDTVPIATSKAMGDWCDSIFRVFISSKNKGFGYRPLCKWDPHIDHVLTQTSDVWIDKTIQDLYIPNQMDMQLTADEINARNKIESECIKQYHAFFDALRRHRIKRVEYDEWNNYTFQLALYFLYKKLYWRYEYPTEDDARVFDFALEAKLKDDKRIENDEKIRRITLNNERIKKYKEWASQWKELFTLKEYYKPGEIPFIVHFQWSYLPTNILTGFYNTLKELVNTCNHVISVKAPVLGFDQKPLTDTDADGNQVPRMAWKPATKWAQMWFMENYFSLYQFAESGEKLNMHCFHLSLDYYFDQKVKKNSNFDNKGYKNAEQYNFYDLNRTYLPVLEKLNKGTKLWTGILFGGEWMTASEITPVADIRLLARLYPMVRICTTACQIVLDEYRRIWSKHIRMMRDTDLSDVMAQITQLSKMTLEDYLVAFPTMCNMVISHAIFNDTDMTQEKFQEHLRVVIAENEEQMISNASRDRKTIQMHVKTFVEGPMTVYFTQIYNAAVAKRNVMSAETEENLAILKEKATENTLCLLEDKYASLYRNMKKLDVAKYWDKTLPQYAEKLGSWCTGEFRVYVSHKGQGFGYRPLCRWDPNIDHVFDQTSDVWINKIPKDLCLSSDMQIGGKKIDIEARNDIDAKSKKQYEEFTQRLKQLGIEFNLFDKDPWNLYTFEKALYFLYKLFFWDSKYGKDDEDLRNFDFQLEEKLRKKETEEEEHEEKKRLRMNKIKNNRKKIELYKEWAVRWEQVFQVKETWEKKDIILDVEFSWSLLPTNVIHEIYNFLTSLIQGCNEVISQRVIEVSDATTTETTDVVKIEKWKPATQWAQLWFLENFFSLFPKASQSRNKYCFHLSSEYRIKKGLIMVTFPRDESAPERDVYDIKGTYFQHLKKLNKGKDMWMDILSGKKWMTTLDNTPVADIQLVTRLYPMVRICTSACEIVLDYYRLIWNKFIFPHDFIESNDALDDIERLQKLNVNDYLAAFPTMCNTIISNTILHEIDMTSEAFEQHIKDFIDNKEDHFVQNSSRNRENIRAKVVALVEKDMADYFTNLYNSKVQTKTQMEISEANLIHLQQLVMHHFRTRGQHTPNDLESISFSFPE